MLEIESHAQLGLYTQHTAEEFDIKLIREENKQEIPLEVERTWVAQHEHDDEVGSIAIEREGDVDNEKLNKWLGKLLSERGVDIFRMKGFISIAGESRRFVFQEFTCSLTDSPIVHGETPSAYQLIFIGRNLDEEDMRKGFDECLA